MSESTTCRQCGAEVDGGALFCSRCGQDMTLVGDEQPTLAVTTAGTPVQPVRSTMRQALRDATLGEYEILSELGRGGMATVFLAHDISLDRKVAIKVMAPHLLEGEGMAERFKLEARTAAQLSHPHIIPIYAVKETAETLYFVMKYVEGRGLDEVIKKTGQLPIPMVKDILTKVGGALGYAHRRDVVHRDIKPGNVMIDEEGTPIVTDFGIAKVAEQKGLTVTGTTIGTPSYMSPEQCEAKPVTGASDQYSLGIVAFEMLTGKLPFEGDSAVTTMYKHCHEDLPPLADFRPDCPTEVRETIERMVAKDPADRWPTLEAAVRKLNNEATPTGVDPIRSQLLELMKEGDTGELLARLSDPSGPVTRRTSGTAAAPTRSRAGLMGAVAAALVVVVGGTLVVLKPWAGGEPAADAGGPVAGQTTADAGQTGSQTQANGGGATPGDGAGAAAGDVQATGSGGGADSDATGGEPVSPTPAAGGGGAQPAGGGATSTARATVARINIFNAPERLEPGERATLQSSAVDAGGITVSGATVAWASDDQAVAVVDANGVVTAVGPGEARLTASVGSTSSSVTITVAEAAVARVALTPTSLDMAVGDQQSLSATAQDASGSTLSGRQVTWRSSNTSVASVSPSGQVTAAGPGSATITAESEGTTAQATVNVLVPTRTAIEALVAAYAQALESRDVAQVRAAYPGLTSDRESTLQNFFQNARDMQVDYTVGDVSEQGTTATAELTGTWRFNDSRAGAQQVPQNATATFERSGSAWRMTSIVDR